MRILLAGLFLLCALSVHGAMTPFTAFRGTGGIIVSSNVGLGTVTIDGSAIAAGTNVPSASTNAIGAPITNLLWGRTLFVDSINGRDALALRGDATKPYLRPMSANSNAVAGDIIYLRPGTYNIGTNTLNLAHGVSLRGAGRGVTFIVATNADDNNPLIAPGSGSVIEDITFIAWTPGGGTDLLKVVAPLALGVAKYWTNAVFRGCDLFGETDVIYLSGANPCMTRYENCFIHGQWDVVVTGNSKQMNVFLNCDIQANAYSHTNDRLQALGDVTVLKTSGGSTNIFNNCRVIATNSYGALAVVADEGAYLVRDFGSLSQTSYTEFASCFLGCAGTNYATRFGDTYMTSTNVPGGWRNSNNVIRVWNCNPQEVIPAATNYAAGINDFLISITQTGPARTVTLPNIGPHGRTEYDGTQLKIREVAGNASTNSVVLIARQGQVIYPLGVTSTNFGSSYFTATLEVRGTNWWIVGSYP